MSCECDQCLCSQVSGRQARQWCEEIGAEYFEGSAKDDHNVEEPFLRAARGGLQQVIYRFINLCSEKKDTTYLYV